MNWAAYGQTEKLDFEAQIWVLQVPHLWLPFPQPWARVRLFAPTNPGPIP